MLKKISLLVAFSFTFNNSFALNTGKTQINSDKQINLSEEGMKALKEKNYKNAEMYLSSGSIAQNQYNFGVMYYTGTKDFPKNLNKAFDYFLNSANGGIPQGMSNVGMMYLNGQGTKKDSKKALFWLRKAEEHNVPQAYMILSYMYMSGEGVKKDEDKSFAYLKKAEKAGYPEASKQIVKFKEYQKQMAEFNKIKKQASKPLTPKQSLEGKIMSGASGIQAPDIFGNVSSSLKK